MAPRAAAIVAAAAAAAVVAVALLRRRRRKKALPPGLTLFERVLDAGACDALARVVEDLAARGARGELGPRCYTPVSSPSFAERRQSRVMLQFGAYANANRVENAATAPLPRELRAVAERLVDAGVFAAAEAPDACCVNLYEAGQWIPDHVDNGKFARPFATVSLVSAQDTVFRRDGAEVVGATRQAFDAANDATASRRARKKAERKAKKRALKRTPAAPAPARREPGLAEGRRLLRGAVRAGVLGRGRVGCGNGKNAPALTANGAHVVACDISLALVEIAKREHAGRRYDAAVGDCTRVPAAARSGHAFASADVLVPFHLRKHGAYWDAATARPAPAHAVDDAAKNATVLQRYCHVYAEGELAALVAAHARVDDAYYDEGNWAVACTKV
ncbi:tRNA methyltransferase [Aureococcus anophagefferens]|nr:tRNA methyltransferase [Aureococcus anophagefferens]